MPDLRLFTVEEADELLPRIHDELLAMRERKHELDALREELSRVVRRTTGNGHVHSERDFDEKRLRAEWLVEQLNEALRRVNGWGVEIKDIEMGLADFPHEREGRVVYLCWRIGEERIEWWHELDTGYAGRQPL